MTDKLITAATVLCAWSVLSFGAGMFLGKVFQLRDRPVDDTAERTRQ